MLVNRQHDVPASRTAASSHKVKARQRQAAEEFDHTSNNRLNKTHRPQYLFSGRIECGICGGPYAIMAKDRYGCTNRQKKLPIAHLDDQTCSNSKTIARAELERRVLKAIPSRLFSVENTRSIIDEVNKEIERISRAQTLDREKLGKDLAVICQKQQVIAEQITERLLSGHPDVKVFNDMLTRLEEQRTEVERKLGEKPVATVGEPKQITVNVSTLKSAFDAMTAIVRHGNPADDVAAGQFNFLRELVQKVVVLPSTDGKTAELTVHGRLAAILASIKAIDEHTAQKRGAFHAEFTRRVKAREFRTTEEKLDILTLRLQTIVA
ncbi:hypothetical protein GH983_22325 (plasmid) [Agrobacterium sp. MA01]|uniref:zinc ribbon domain-containing protein n=1 Tax=Agrobacterium sp. MA01 TaxID=2664893 RepID=UPI00129B6AAE|nr:zinc ribbon domain-containing protein [Agrobacterium sp. MA01]QGG93288.1 hypothetical protein GH983_22325 [Agrobacterium sp. MA01]